MLITGVGGHTRQKSWGIDGYKVPNNDWSLLKVKSSFWHKVKKENFMDQQARKKKEIPAPNAYVIKSYWSGQYSDGGGHSGRWLKRDKITFIDEIIELKKFKMPGPGKYNVTKFKIPNVPKQNTEKGDFIENCRWYGLQTPGWKYKINWDSIRPKTPVALYYAKKGEDGKIIRPVISLKTKKTKDPAPGSYEMEDSFKKTQWPKKMFLFGKQKMNTYID
jgi:hypothetical protein